MNLQKLILIVLQASVLLNVLAIGLRASVQDATYLFRRPGELVRALLAMNVLMPLFALALISIFDLHPAVRIALVALAVSPIPPLLPTKLMKEGGTESYAVGLLVAVSSLAIIFVPLAMEVVELVRGVPLQITAASIAKVVFVTVLLPICLGVALHKLAPVLSERAAKPIALISGLALLACMVAIGSAFYVGTRRQRHGHRTRGLRAGRTGGRPLPRRASAGESHFACPFDCLASPRNRARTGPGELSRADTRGGGGAPLPARQRICFDPLSSVD
jgi:predicted Na+-dependent transporter